MCSVYATFENQRYRASALRAQLINGAPEIDGVPEGDGFPFHCGALNLDLAPDLNHLIVRQLKIVAHAGRVAAHRGEQSLLPPGQALAVLGRHG